MTAPTTRALPTASIFRVLPGLALLMLAGAGPVAAQVVIEERVELRAASSSEKVQGAASTQTLGSTQIVVPRDGRLQLYFSGADRLYSPIPAGATVDIFKKSGEEMPPPVVATASGFEDGDDTLHVPVLPRYPDSYSYPRRFYTCYGTNEYITQYYYYGDGGEASTYDAGLVAEGDTLTFGYVSDTGAYGGTLTPGDTSGAATWGAELGYYDACLRDWRERVAFEVVVIPNAQLLSQDDEPLTGTPATEEVLMVSKFVTDENLEANDQPFESTYVTSGDTTDVYTFRPQLAGIEAGQAVDFRVQVFRAGAPTGYDETFTSVEGTLDDGTAAYRGERFLRLVSNAEPPNAPSGATYDDAYAGGQTILVRLGDHLRVTPQVNGTAQDSLELPVGGPPESDSDNAIRTAEINFQSFDGVNSHYFSEFNLRVIA